MGKYFSVLCMLISVLFFGQNYKKTLSKEICKCIDKVKIEGKTKKQLEMELGICMLKSSMPYSKQIKRDYGIDLDKDMLNEDKMGALGEEMGTWMVTDCGSTIAKFLVNEEMDDDSRISEGDVKIINGRITKIEKENFVVFYVMGDNRMLTKYYWLSTIESDIDLPKDYGTLLNKKVTISYYSSEIFDARINAYRSLDIISTLRTD